MRVGDAAQVRLAAAVTLVAAVPVARDDTLPVDVTDGDTENDPWLLPVAVTDDVAEKEY